MTQRHLKITSVPRGEAPLWVREKWVGLALPLGQRSTSPGAHWGFGVLSGPRNLFSCLYALFRGKYEKNSGYVVQASTAVELLTETSPEAADWWRTHASHLLKPGKMFLFDQGAGYVPEQDG